MVGAIGERNAKEFLRKKGYRIIAENFRTSLGEIDVIAEYAGSVVFVEIKTRATSSLGPPYLSVTPLKQRHITRCALAYLKNRGGLDSSWRIDVVSVKLNIRYELENIEIIENAVEDNNRRF